MKRAILLLLAIVLIVVAPYFIKPTMTFGLITGISMNPVLKEGDIITYEEISPSAVKVGDIIVYRIPLLTRKLYNCPPIVAHRVVEIKDAAKGLHYRTKGDNSPASDPWSVRPCDLVGKVSRQISYLGFTLLFLQSRPGLIFIITTLFASALCLYADELSQGRQKLQVSLPLAIEENRHSKSKYIS